MSWATNHDASLEKLQQVQGSLMVGLIMVPRTDFLTCGPSETAAKVKKANKLNFSYIPVVDQKKRVVGLYNAERWFGDDAPNHPVESDYLPLSEDIVIGADASIFDFIRSADEVSTKLVVSGDGVAGLVSLSDVQQLPVRAALFALVTSLEMAMAMVIESRWPNAEEWMELLTENRRGKLKDQIKIAKQRDGFVSEIAFTQFGDKSTLLHKGGLVEGTRTAHEARFNAIQDLRNDLAHANRYADTPEAAVTVCRVVRDIYEIKDQLLRAGPVIEKFKTAT
ncbi:CBS domain-containing protein [Sulfitobacter sp. 1A13496]|uniref:CBS domain-containing protein n=1 Tax=Sulfitobacter sp. 1A13496 TaxID=3368596 RepID=UPI0037472EE4